MRFPATLRPAAFLLVLAVEFSLPAGLLGGSYGYAGGLSAAVLFFLYLRIGGTKRLMERLGARPLSQSEAPALGEMLRELARRTKLIAPQLVIVEDPAVNVAVFGFGRAERHIAITRGFVTRLRREESFAWLAAALWEAQEATTPVSSLSALYWYCAERALGEDAGKRWRGALRAAVLYPFVWLPSIPLRLSRSGDRAEKFAASATAMPLALSEGLRKMLLPTPDARAYPASLRRLFLRPPGRSDSLAVLWGDAPWNSDEPRTEVRRLELLLGLRAES